ncbi:hypothetical protein E2542_SST04972 [Spatholobus suberectus]|nr:hypothetical protein E2542_SST04972 [Spatholobus suberectus]
MFSGRDARCVEDLEECTHRSCKFGRLGCDSMQTQSGLANWTGSTVNWTTGWSGQYIRTAVLTNQCWTSESVLNRRTVDHQIDPVWKASSQQCLKIAISEI